MALCLLPILYALCVIFSSFVSLMKATCTFGPGCTFPCRCSGSDGDCNEDGTCKSGRCAQGIIRSVPWEGPGCQYGNIAQGKATHLGVFQETPLLTDGRFDNDSCAEHFFMYMGLGSESVVRNVSIYLFQHSRVRVDVTINGRFAGHRKCAFFEGAVSTIALQCDTPVIGSEVMIAFHGIGPLVCEIAVIGYKYQSCTAGSYGPGCMTPCPEKCKADTCDEITGQCPECKPSGYLNSVCNLANATLKASGNKTHRESLESMPTSDGKIAFTITAIVSGIILLMILILVAYVYVRKRKGASIRGTLFRDTPEVPEVEQQTIEDPMDVYDEPSESRRVPIIERSSLCRGSVTAILYSKPVEPMSEEEICLLPSTMIQGHSEPCEMNDN